MSYKVVWHVSYEVMSLRTCVKLWSRLTHLTSVLQLCNTRVVQLRNTCVKSDTMSDFPLLPLGKKNKNKFIFKGGIITLCMLVTDYEWKSLVDNLFRRNSYQINNISRSRRKAKDRYFWLGIYVGTAMNKWCCTNIAQTWQPHIMTKTTNKPAMLRPSTPPWPAILPPDQNCLKRPVLLCRSTWFWYAFRRRYNTSPE